MMAYKCIMCQDPISKNENEWGMEIRPLWWMHYKCIEHLWDAYSSMKKIDTHNHVYCTADGEFPEHNQMVIYEDGGNCYIGGYNPKIGLWFEQSEDQYDYDTDPVIYWKPLTSLKEEYERQRGVK